MSATLLQPMQPPTDSSGREDGWSAIPASESRADRDELDLGTTLPASCWISSNHPILSQFALRLELDGKRDLDLEYETR